MIDIHKLRKQENGSYKFNRVSTNTTAIIDKKDNTYTFITFFGHTSWVLDNSDSEFKNNFEDFTCLKQSEKYVERSRRRSKRLRIFQKIYKLIGEEIFYNGELPHT